MVKLAPYLPLTGCKAFISTNEIVLMKAVRVLKRCVRGKGMEIRLMEMALLSLYARSLQNLIRGLIGCK